MTNNCYYFQLVFLIFINTYFNIATNNVLKVSNQEKQILYDLYQCTNGSYWTWKSLIGQWNFTNEDENPCIWQGITCTYFNNTNNNSSMISEISLHDYNLNGFIPLSIGNLSRLINLDLSFNKLTSTIPYTLNQIKYLESLDLSFNFITSSIPSLLFNNLTKLRSIQLFNNFLIGTIPIGIFNELSQLKTLDLSSNQLNGTIPINSYIEKEMFLEILILSYNSITGTIPSRLDQFIHLTSLELGNNKLYGTIPLSLQNLTHLETLWLNDMYMYGTIPSFIGNSFENLTELILKSNKFTGSIPESIGNLSKLTYLNLYNNSITNTLPSSLQFCTLMVYLFLNENSFEGTIPTWFRNYHSLKILDLAVNRFSGTIPQVLCNLTNLRDVYINDNYFYNTIPRCFDQLTFMRILVIDGNLFTGIIPSFISAYDGLSLLSLGSNLFTGDIPNFIGNLTYLLFLSLKNNYIVEQIPDALGYLDKLTYIDLSNNLLSGSIPLKLQYLSYLQFLYFHHNLFRGALPTILFEYSTHLVDIQLNDNHFIGTIPAQISKITTLQILFLQNNQLKGSINQIFDNTNQPVVTNIQLSSNQLTGTISETFFLFQNLQAFSAVQNCIHGSIPTSICNNSKLLSLALDGLQCSSSCQIKLFSSSYELKSYLKHGIPQCIFGMSHLQVLHLSGNGLTGKLPEDAIHLGPSLIDLSLSYNLLTGTIPSYIKNRTWKKLDLSHNKLQGTLDDISTINDTSIYLRNNRLSGVVPSAVTHLRDIAILEGNLFSCAYGRKDLPKHDEAIATYECGSNSFDIAYYIWLGVLVGIFLISICAIWYMKSIHTQRFQFISIHVNTIYSWWYIKESILVNQKEFQLSGLKQYHYINNMLIKNSFVCTIYILLILMPIYILLHHYFGTHTYNYAWIVSAAYLSGLTAADVLLVSLIIFLFIQIIFALWCYHKEMKSIVFNKNDVIFNNHEIPVISIITDTIDASSEDIIDYLRDSSDFINLESTATNITHTTTTHTTTTPNNDNDLLPSNNEDQDNRGELFPRIIVYSVYFLINIVIVTGVNVTYIYVILYQSNEIIILAQILLSLFKLFWNNFALSFLSRHSVYHLTKLQHQEENKKPLLKEFFFVQVCIALCSNIIIPCITVIIVSPDCLYNLFTASDEVTSTFGDRECSWLESTTYYCYEYTVYSQTTSYNPPFLYSYQCSSSFIQSYVSVFLYMCIATTFIIPILKAIIIYIHQHLVPERFWYKLVDRFMHVLLKSSTNHPVKNSSLEFVRESQLESILLNKRDIFSPYLEANHLLITDLIFVGLLLTFGTVFPPLAIALLIAIIVRISIRRIIVGRYIDSAIKYKSYFSIFIIEEECCDIPSTSTLMWVSWVLLFISSSFYTLFIFDALGDKYVLAASYWVFIVMPLLPVIMYILSKPTLYIMNKYWDCNYCRYNNPSTSCMCMMQSKQPHQQQYNDDNNDNHQLTSSIQIEIGSISHSSNMQFSSPLHDISI